MRHLLAFALAAVLAGCASYSGQGLVPGQATAADVDAKMGPSAEQRPGTNGETVRYYPRQPNGRQTYAARFGADGKLLVIEQRLTPANVAWLMPGAWRAENVRDLFGPPYQNQYFPNLERQIWTYKMYADGYLPKDLYVQMSGDGVLREVLLLDDPQYASRGSINRF